MPHPKLTVTVRNSGVRLVLIEIPDAITTPEEFAAVVDRDADSLSGELPVFLNGRAPIWGYSMLVHAAHATPAVGVFEPRRNGYVIVASHDARYVPGQIIPAEEV